ncbi:hypothetical protein KR074_006323, partial [Drosophila pseudoananassae]
ILKCKALGILQDLQRIQGALQPISKVDDAMLHVRHGQIATMFSDFKAIHGELEDLDILQISSDLRWTVLELVATMQAEIEHETTLRSSRIAAHSTLANGRESTSLRESAFEAVRSLEVSDESYDVALNLLEKRFNNRRLIFQAHVNEILGL